NQPCDGTGLFLFNLSTLRWETHWDPRQAGYPYEVPKLVWDIIGGDGRGGAEKKFRDGIADENIRKMFFPETTSTRTRTNPTASSTSSNSPSSEDPAVPGSNGDNDGGPPTAAIVGGTLGGIAVLLLIVAVIFFLRRRKRSPFHTRKPTAHPAQE